MTIGKKMNIKLKRERKKKNRKHYYLVCIHVLITRLVKWAWLLTLPGHAYFCGVARELSQRRPSVMGFLESVEEEYATRDLYRILGLTKDCSESEIRRAYHKLSLKVHPDRVDPENIEESTKKFQVRPLDTITCYTVGNNFVLFFTAIPPQCTQPLLWVWFISNTDPIKGIQYFI